MGADEYRNYILGFIFYKYLSEKLHLHVNDLLETEAAGILTKIIHISLKSSELY
jgi:type I restriction enzyme M protein